MNGIEKHQHGGDVYRYKGCIDFSSNCNPLGTPQGVIRAAAIDELPERERMVILLRFYKNLTQDKVSKVLGVSQVQVSRIERRAVAKLREALTE